MPINRTPNSGVLLINRAFSNGILLIDRTLAKLEDNAKCASLPKLRELVKKPSNLTRTGKEKPHRLISHSLAQFVEPIGRLCFCFAESLMGLNDALAIDRAELKGGEIAIIFSK